MPPPTRSTPDACPGALRLHRAEDGRVARIRVPGGVLTGRQAELLGDAAERLGDGRLGITSRGNVEIRGLAERDAPEWTALLTGAGLLPSYRHERVRNIVAGPLSGLDGRGHADARSWAAELDALLCGQEWTAELSGRFLFVLDDGRGDVSGLGGDVTAAAAPGGRAVLCVAGQRVALATSDVPRAALAAAGAFLDAARAAGTGAWRVGELPSGHVPDLGAALRRAGLSCDEAGVPSEPGAPAAGPAPGLLPAPDGTAVLSVFPRLGRLSVAQWRALLPLPGGELRLTPWRGIVLPGCPAAGAEGRLAELERAGFVTRADSPWYGAGTCTGLPGCAKSRTDVRSDAAAAVASGARVPGGADGSAVTPADAAVPAAERHLPVYWSGCERRCGHPGGDWVDVLATGAPSASASDAYRVTVHRAPAPDAVSGTPPRPVTVPTPPTRASAQ
ncbi:cobalamin biosynthesis protein CobG [Streptomyces sp. TS71-3]|uniref:cobalamin biosynthesis protein CobG n=1 Tax=Streptomyces sp. TS71-3 TaxID=2733862 RepID=UPI002016C470|nr:cobalamin biosynthesis protein CobG [Streptomyces sp. TS71-3]